jgi:CxxC-x17-CxxC domain-containing protein
MVFQERNLTCAECGNSFAFTVEDQQYHAEKGYTNEPKRCPSCRDARRSERRSSGGGGFGSSGPRQMFSVVCAQCGKDAEVPFRPTGDRPVYCSDCYRQQAGPSRGPSSYR